MNVARQPVAPVIATVFMLAISLAAFAQETQVVPIMPDRMQFPGLLVKTTQPGIFVEAPSVETDVSVRIRGIVARAVVRQQFENAADHCVEAVYVFPLPDDAAVDAMRLKVGPRTIEGEIRERADAVRVYEEAKREGRKASLLEQHRPNLFTVSVASIGAGEAVEVEIEYQQIVAYDGRFSLRLPLATAPRYTPRSSESRVLLPPMRFRLPFGDDRGRPVTLTIDLDAGIPLSEIASPTHALQTETLSATRTKITPSKVRIAADRDFELVWRPRLGAFPQTAAFSERAGDDRYTLLMLFPPDVANRAAAVLPRETVFVIDTSGSMGGPSIVQAKRSLRTALERLRASDSFNVIAFSDQAHALFPESRRADRDVVEAALRWVDDLHSDGGTEMLGALQLALPPHAFPSAGVRQIVFITDGQVGNEPAVFQYIREHAGGARIFTVGIGAAPNTYFMRNAARAGRGTFTHIGDVAEVESKMTAMFRKLESPVLSNLALQIDRDAEVWPEAIPDLYAGDALVVAMRTRASADAVVRGRIAADGWNGSFDASLDDAPSGISKLWARAKIDAVRDRVFTGADANDVRAEIVALGLAHHLVTEHTSLVAVDTTPASVDARSCTPQLVPLDLPAGWGGLDGALPQTATPATLWILLGLALLACAIGGRT